MTSRTLDRGLPLNYNEGTSKHGRLLSDLSASSPSGHTCFLNNPILSPASSLGLDVGFQGFLCLGLLNLQPLAVVEGSQALMVAPLLFMLLHPLCLFNQPLKLPLFCSSAPPFLSCPRRQFYSESGPNPNLVL